MCSSKFEAVSLITVECGWPIFAPLEERHSAASRSSKPKIMLGVICRVAYEDIGTMVCDYYVTTAIDPAIDRLAKRPADRERGELPETQDPTYPIHDNKTS